MYLRGAASCLLFGASACLVAFATPAETVVDGRAIADERQGANWLSYGRTYAEHHYSPLTGINAGNVRQLGLAWFVDLPGQRSLGATPLAVPKYDDLSVEDMRAIFMYVRHGARQAA